MDLLPHSQWLYSRLGKFVADAAILGVALLVAYLIRFEGAIPPFYGRQLLELGPYVILLTSLSLGVSGTYNRVWRYTDLRDAMVVAMALSVPVVVFTTVRLTVPDAMISIRLPLSVIAAYFAIAVVGAVGIRATWRVLYERRARRGAGRRAARRILVVGAGDVGIRLARDLGHRDDVRLIGFLDDEVRNRRATILGVRVRGTTSELVRVVVAHGVDEVVVACSLQERQMRTLLDDCDTAGVRVRVLNLTDMEVSEHVSGRLREIRIDDLLPRQVARFDVSAPSLVDTYRGRRVLVTGAGGSVGSELCRRLLGLYPEKLLLLDQDENNLFETYSDLVHLGAPRDRLVHVIADCRQSHRLRRVFAEYKPEVILHAAAFKHVPFLEEHPVEAVENNVLATSMLLDLAVEYGAYAFVFISTDKAVKPTSVMGATKRAAEIVVQAAAGRGVRVSCVRFGNVLDSRGSVVPIFRRQIARGGPVTITHADATRYFMTMSEAARLVLQAGSIGGGGEVFVLNMGEPVRILDLANDMIRLAGLKVSEDVEIKIVGLRPGERVHEELVEDGAALHQTMFKDILLADVPPRPLADLRCMLQRFSEAVAREDPVAVRAVLGDNPIQLRNYAGEIAAAPAASIIAAG